MCLGRYVKGWSFFSQRQKFQGQRASAARMYSLVHDQEGNRLSGPFYWVFGCGPKDWLGVHHVEPTTAAAVGFRLARHGQESTRQLKPTHLPV